VHHQPRRSHTEHTQPSRESLRCTLGGTGLHEQVTNSDQARDTRTQNQQLRKRFDGSSRVAWLAVSAASMVAITVHVHTKNTDAAQSQPTDAA